MNHSGAVEDSNDTFMRNESDVLTCQTIPISLERLTSLEKGCWRHEGPRVNTQSHAASCCCLPGEDEPMDLGNSEDGRCIQCFDSDFTYTKPPLYVIGEDAIKLVASYLPFATIATLSSVSSSLSACLSHGLWMKIFVDRNSANPPIDTGTGFRAEFPLSHPQWRPMMLAREHAQRILHTGVDSADRGILISSLMSRIYNHMTPSSGHFNIIRCRADIIIVEKLRLIVELFDCHGMLLHTSHLLCKG
jgi:hypothetical protein